MLASSQALLGYQALEKSPPEADRDLGGDLDEIILIKPDFSDDLDQLKFDLWKQRVRKLVIYAGILVLLACAAIILASVVPFNGTTRGTKWKFPPPEVHVTTKSKSNNRLHPCGNSSSEALALGCTFNQLTWAWLPPDCPMYANDDFMAAEEWVYWEDLEQTKMVGDNVWAEVLDGERMIFAELREHATHCVYYLLSASQVVRDRSRYYDKMVEYEHHEHCANMLLGLLRRLPEWNELNTLAGTVSFDQYCSEQ